MKPQHITLINEMKISRLQSFGIATTLVLLVALTHSQHFATQLHLPPATWAAFFLGGFYLRRFSLFAAGLALVGSIDYVAMTWGGITEAYFAPVYLFMIPAYAVLWLAGRSYATRYTFQWLTIPCFLLSLSSIVVAEILASGSFYLLMSHQVEISFRGLLIYLITWIPESLQSFFFWMGLATVLHCLVKTIQGSVIHPSEVND